MSYTPPEYPNAIPSTDDLPDRVDDIDWVFAARYNELKKELRAVMIELGILPKGNYADIKTRLNYMQPSFHNRGDPNTVDFTHAVLTADNNWHDLDLSAIVPAGAKVVTLHATWVDDAAGSLLQFRRNGNLHEIVISTIRIQVANRSNDGDVTVPCDDNRIIEYKISTASPTGIYISVKGWWK